MVRRKILISAGEASGDLYAASLAEALRSYAPGLEFFGCAGPKMRAAGVQPVADASKLAVVGLTEVLSHLPGIYREYRKLCRASEQERPAAAILTDSPDFHLRVAAHLAALNIPVFYLVAPQVWAWRRGRLRQLRRNVRKLLCIFPFEENFFRSRGVDAVYIGHPGARLVKPRLDPPAFRSKHGIAEDRVLITLLPGSRKGEIGRHLPVLAEAVRRLRGAGEFTFVAAIPEGSVARFGRSFFQEGLRGEPVILTEGETWDAISAADLALAASGTVATETALLGTPMVTFYRVSRLTYLLGRLLVDVPYFTMVNLIAGEPVVAELIQDECTGKRLFEEAMQLLGDKDRQAEMKAAFGRIRAALLATEDPFQRAVREIASCLEDDPAGVAPLVR